jgi:4-amino-4-deoxychorismate lyase
MTPASPLLRGTKRQLLLERGVIQEEDITVNNLKQFQKVGFINAMIDIGTIPPLGIEQILP